MKDVLMSKGALKIVEVCAGVKPAESVLIITEPKMINIAKSIFSAVYAVGAEPVIAVMEPRTIDGQEPPKSIAAAMINSDVFIAAVYKSITHSKAVKNAVEAGSRGIMLTQFEDELMISGGIEADFNKIAPVCKAVARALENSNEVKLTTPHGTDLTFCATKRRGNAMTCLVQPGEFAPMPTIEANVSPLEGTATGTIVANASIPYIGIGVLKENVVVKVENGMITAITGGEEAKILSKNLASKNDPLVYNIAELGVGLNPNCKFMGLMLEDEGVYGSVHIGIGTNITLGGNLKAACHYDLIMTEATIIADGKTILENGVVCV
ncbi:aminopeptidase [Clostridium sp. 'deep sea']|uniref:aminopeptidase n=1 Tax=Clostridium sp. 'deep sea' TaxID=2779445 RepID=UPI0018964F7B|nr:aminopeptidase [Clostridium sp. 'deep sea']QOR36838.1 aminopeptidase [Clostridium sp. 'deep sea']